MENLTTILYLLIAVLCANIIHALYPKIPLALYQIAAGALLILSPFHTSHIELDPEIFMMLIIGPLLFNDGQKQSIRKLTYHLRSIWSMAILLAIVTVGVIGVGLHLGMPHKFSLPAAFMLAAIVTPTDAVAVKSLTTTVSMPENVNEVLEYESLFNDASGLVLFNLAVATLISGDFSFINGIATFLYVFFGGIIVGLLLGALIVNLRLWMLQEHADISNIDLPINLLTPIVVYLAAEEIHVSGIIAVVAAGIAHSIWYERLHLTSSELQISSRSTWHLITDVLNGLVFALLGVTLPNIFKGVSAASFMRVLIIAALVYAAMTILRYLWARTDIVKLCSDPGAARKEALLLAIGGVHGTIALAMAFSMPATISGSPLPYRNQYILITTVVIFVSLLVGTIFFPMLLPQKKLGYEQQDFNDHLVASVYAAINYLKGVDDDHSNEANIVQNNLSSQLREHVHIDRREFEELLDGAQKIELATVDRLHDEEAIDDEQAELYSRFFAKMLAYNQRNVMRNYFSFIWHGFQRRRKRREIQKQIPAEQLQKHILDNRDAFCMIVREVNQAVDDYLDQQANSKNQEEIYNIKMIYANRIQIFNRQNKLNTDLLNKLFLDSFREEHNYVSKQLANGTINRDLANALNKQISTDELVYMQSIE
jgi:CPA1 family monovalent cation:H+ antiporter